MPKVEYERTRIKTKEEGATSGSYDHVIVKGRDSFRVTDLGYTVDELKAMSTDAKKRGFYYYFVPIGEFHEWIENNDNKLWVPAGSSGSSTQASSSDIDIDPVSSTSTEAPRTTTTANRTPTKKPTPMKANPVKKEYKVGDKRENSPGNSPAPVKTSRELAMNVMTGRQQRIADAWGPVMAAAYEEARQRQMNRNSDMDVEEEDIPAEGTWVAAALVPEQPAEADNVLVRSTFEGKSNRSGNIFNHEFFTDYSAYKPRDFDWSGCGRSVDKSFAHSIFDESDHISFYSKRYIADIHNRSHIY